MEKRFEKSSTVPKTPKRKPFRLEQRFYGKCNTKSHTLSQKPQAPFLIRQWLVNYDIYSSADIELTAVCLGSVHPEYWSLD